jgi:hypothetical protein
VIRKLLVSVPQAMGIWYKEVFTSLGTTCLCDENLSGGLLELLEAWVEIKVVT